MNELYAVLMSWAVTLSGYPAPTDLPEVVMIPHGLMVERACAGRECRVMGWFPPGDQIFVDSRLDLKDNLYHSSILLHEMVHYLQHQSGKYGTTYSCDTAMTMEREAYAVQREYLVRYGVYLPVGASMHLTGCIAGAAHDH